MTKQSLLHTQNTLLRHKRIELDHFLPENDPVNQNPKNHACRGEVTLQA
jgi:hypothetical protein